MATPPTLILDNELSVGWDTSPDPGTTASFNSAIGDVWVAGSIAESEVVNIDPPTNSGTAQTFTARGTVDTTNYCEVHTYTAVVANTLTGQTVSAVRQGSALKWGMNVVRFSGSDGIGAVPAGEAETDGTAPSLNITTTADNSAIVVFVGDFNAADGTSRTWRTVNSITPTAGNGGELTYFRNSANYTVYVGYYSDAGAAGVKTVGLSAPTTMKASIVAVEVKGSAAGSAAAGRFPTPQLGVPFVGPGVHPVARAFQVLGDTSGAQFPALDETGAGADSAVVAAAVPLADTAAGDDTATVAAAVPLADTAAATDTATVTAAIPLTETATGTDAVVVTVPVSLTDTAAAADSLTNVPAAVPLSETASASDVVVQAVAAPLSDTATGDDSLSIQSSSVIVVDPNQAKPGFPSLLTSLRTSAGQVYGDATSPGGSQSITLDDTATGTDALTVAAAVPVADTATGADTATVAAAIPLSDGGNGDDSLSAVQAGTVDAYQAWAGVAWLFTSPRAASQQNIGDTFSGPSALVETATGADSLTAAPAVPLAETAAADDALTVAVTTTLAETATATDLVAAAVAVPLDENGTASDSLNVQVLGGADANQWMPPNKWGITRPGVAVDPPAMQLLGDASGTTLLSVSDTATASDDLTISVAVVMTETAVAADALSVAVVVPLSELVAAADSLALATVLALSDTASALDDVHISGQGIQGSAYPNPASGAPGNVYPRSAGLITGSVG